MTRLLGAAPADGRRDAMANGEWWTLFILDCWALLTKVKFSTTGPRRPAVFLRSLRFFCITALDLAWILVDDVGVTDSQHHKKK